jgi:hypothetical protein
MSAALDVAGEGRRVVLDDLAADEILLSKAEGASAHPVLLARAHVAHAVVQLQLAREGLGEPAADAAMDHCEAAFDLAQTLQSSGPRMELVGQVGGVVAGGLELMRHSQRRVAGRLLEDVAVALAEAFGEQAEESRRGTITLAAAQALADGAKVVRGKARTAVLQRAFDMATDARTDLARSGEVAKASLAADTLAQLQKSLGSTDT